MNVASIDIGSNTILLLIAEVKDDKKLVCLRNEYRIPRISKGLTIEKAINNSKINLLVEILAEYKNIAEDYNCDTFLVKATNAMRVAVNSKEIVKKVKADLGMQIEVITGEEEARLSYLGARSYYSDFNDMFVLDIGGGSTEFIYGKINEILFRKSFPSGAVNLTEKNITGYPVIAKEISSLDENLSKTFSEIKNFAKDRIPLVAVAGTPTSLLCMLQNLKGYSENLVEGAIITFDSLDVLSSKLSSMKPTEIFLEYDEVVRGREDVIYTGSKILLKVMEYLGLDQLYVSGRGLRYGSIIQFMSEKQ